MGPISSGKYSASSAYNIQFAGQVPSTFLNLIWTAWAPPRCKVFLWLLLQNRLRTAARLQLHGWKKNYFCALCERSLETAQHLFVGSPFLQDVWAAVAAWSSFSNLYPSSWTLGADLEDWFYILTGRGTKAAHTISIPTLWTIWKQRNAVFFRECRRAVQALISEIKDTGLTWLVERFLIPSMVDLQLVSN